MWDFSMKRPLMVSIPLQDSCLIICPTWHGFQIIFPPFFIWSPFWQWVNIFKKLGIALEKLTIVLANFNNSSKKMFIGLLWSQHRVGTGGTVVCKTKFLLSCTLNSDETSKHKTNNLVCGKAVENMCHEENKNKGKDRIDWGSIRERSRVGREKMQSYINVDRSLPCEGGI